MSERTETQRGVEVEPHLERIAEQVKDAEGAILSTVTKDSTPYTPRELQDKSRNGDGWSRDVMGIAFWDLVSRGVLVVDASLRVMRKQIGKDKAGAGHRE